MSPRVGHGSPLQFSCLESPMDRRAWRAIGHGVTDNRTGLSVRATHTGPISGCQDLLLICACWTTLAGTLHKCAARVRLSTNPASGDKQRCLTLPWERSREANRLDWEVLEWMLMLRLASGGWKVRGHKNAEAGFLACQPGWGWRWGCLSQRGFVITSHFMWPHNKWIYASLDSSVYSNFDGSNWSIILPRGLELRWWHNHVPHFGNRL